MTKKKTKKRIQAKCKCGKRYQFHSHMAGKQCKCKCGKTFIVDCIETKEASPPSASSQTRITAKDMPPADPTWWNNPVFIGLSITLALATLAASKAQTTMMGVQFIQFYVGFAMFCVIGIFVARFTSCSTFAGLVLAVVSFELLGLARYSYGITHDMGRFDLMVRLMIAGPFVGASVAFIEGGSSGSGYAAGGSCGGGGCGGGGCGGCGG